MAKALHEHRVVVIGAGVAGLVAALQLAQRNLQVTLLEAAATPGGKMRQPIVDGAAIDAPQCLRCAGCLSKSMRRLVHIYLMSWN